MTTARNISKKAFHKGRLTLIILICLILACVGGFFLYVTDYYPAGTMASQALVSNELVTVTKRGDDSIVFAPVGSSSVSGSRGLVFYPGGKVEYTAYAPLMRQLAEQGWHCVLLKMPFNLAVFDMDAGDDIPEEFPQIQSWYIGGHSLGGSMAASHVADDDDFDGLILLASYSTENLALSGLNVYSIYGTEDLVLNRENYEKYRKNLPANAKELVIEGGCHSYFGDYGAQEGDGTPTISREEQLAATVDFLQ